ncbi:hypothetical protein AB0N81_03645 [Streptomyces sp. NPDC093510]|uniref:hypothetical protein n=1 Tax=Streptomyces sp. NPDC093510 TaxID=3155199 RepID=UPI0034316FDA
MLRHAIAPTRRYTKASHDVVRHQCLNSDAKILLLYVQGLSEADVTARSLGEHAARLGIKGRAYQRAKQLLTESGYLHAWRWQGERGRWVTEQLLANVTLTGEEAGRARVGDGPPPTTHTPTVGGPGTREPGGSYPEEQREKNLPHPPPEDPEPAADTELAEAERVLLSLRHVNRDLLLGVREARVLAGTAAEWLRRGISAGDLRKALTAGLPSGGVRSAVGFVRHRLVQKLPDRAGPTPSLAEVAAARPGLVTCAGPGAEHVFRPLAEETRCGRCRAEGATSTTANDRHPQPLPWRDRLAGAGA